MLYTAVLLNRNGRLPPKIDVLMESHCMLLDCCTLVSPSSLESQPRFRHSISALYWPFSKTFIWRWWRIKWLLHRHEFKVVKFNLITPNICCRITSFTLLRYFVLKILSRGVYKLINVLTIFKLGVILTLQI